jgi:hypothetical protein
MIAPQVLCRVVARICPFAFAVTSKSTARRQLIFALKMAHTGSRVPHPRDDFACFPLPNSRQSLNFLADHRPASIAQTRAVLYSPPH